MLQQNTFRKKWRPNRTTKLFRKLNNLAYITGSASFWIEEVDYSKAFVKVFDKLTVLQTILLVIFMILEFSALFVEVDKLTEKQHSDNILFAFAHPVIFLFCLVIKYYEKDLQNTLYCLTIELKALYNDSVVENEMLRKVKIYTISCFMLFSMTVIFYGIDGMVQVIYTEEPFTTVITVWPSVEDRSTTAGVIRLINYIFWWLLIIRVYGAYLLVISMAVCLSHQYKNLQNYFKSLSDIFDQNLKQAEREMEYEKAIKVGIKLHANTLWCTKQFVHINNFIYAGQILVNVSVLVILLSQMVNSERTLGNTFVTLMTMCCLLISTGLFMWTAGDITVEASHLSTAMYLSGWENCRGKSSMRVRQLLLVAMTQSQKPVSIYCLGVIKLSYKSYLSIVKSSYSLFSVLY